MLCLLTLICFVTALSLLGISVMDTFKRPMNFVKWRLAEFTPLQRLSVLSAALVNEVNYFCSFLLKS